MLDIMLKIESQKQKQHQKQRDFYRPVPGLCTCSTVPGADSPVGDYPYPGAYP